MPVYRSAARSSMEAALDAALGILSRDLSPTLPRVVARGDLRSGNSGAVPPAHQHAILRPAHVSDTGREPDPDRDQGDGESKGGDVGQHPVPEIVGIPGHLISREIIRWRRFCRVRLLRRLAGDAAPKFQDAVLVWRWDRLLMRHGMPAGDEEKPSPVNVGVPGR